MENLKLKNNHRLVIGNLNINSISDKFDILKLNTPEDIESIFIKINLIKTKWLFCGCYHPPSQSDQYFFESSGKELNKYSKHDKFMLVGNSTLKNQNHFYHNSFMNTMPRTMSRKTFVLKMH